MKRAIEAERKEKMIKEQAQKMKELQDKLNKAQAGNGSGIGSGQGMASGAGFGALASSGGFAGAVGMAASKAVDAQASAKAREILVRREKQFLEEVSELRDRLDRAHKQVEKERERCAELEDSVGDLKVDKEKMAYQNDELQVQLQKKERANSQMLEETTLKVEHLTLQLSNAHRSRIWREKYTSQLSEQLKRARYELMQLGRKPEFVSKCIQTQYCDLWAMNVLKAPEKDVDMREKWTAHLEAAAAAGDVPLLSLQHTLDTIGELFGEKLRADLAADNVGKDPCTMGEFMYDFYFDKYGMTKLTSSYLNQIGLSLLHHADEHPTVHVFAALLGLADENATVDGRGPADRDAERIAGSLAAARKRMGQAIVASTHLFGVDWEEELAVLNHRLSTEVPKVVPLRLYAASGLLHALTADITKQLPRMPFMRELMHTARSDELQLELRGMDFGLPLSEEQLPQLYKLLVEACDILKVDVPQIYLSGRDTWDTCLVCPVDAKPFLVLTARMVESLKPRELQVVLAQQLLGLVRRDLQGVINACSLANLVPNLFLREDVARAQWASSVVPTIIRLQQAIDLTADRVALVVAQDYGLVVDTIMKMHVASKTIGNQLRSDGLLRQAAECNAAASKFLDHYDEKRKNLGVQAGTRKLYGATMSVHEGATTDLANIPHGSLSMSLVSSSNSLSMLRARELKRWEEGDEYHELMRTAKPRTVSIAVTANERKYYATSGGGSRPSTSNFSRPSTSNFSRPSTVSSIPEHSRVSTG